MSGYSHLWLSYSIGSCTEPMNPSQRVDREVCNQTHQRFPRNVIFEHNERQEPN